MDEKHVDNIQIEKDVQRCIIRISTLNKTYIYKLILYMSPRVKDSSCLSLLRGVMYLFVLLLLGPFGLLLQKGQRATTKGTQLVLHKLKFDLNQSVNLIINTFWVLFTINLLLLSKFLYKWNHFLQIYLQLNLHLYFWGWWGVIKGCNWQTYLVLKIFKNKKHGALFLKMGCLF